MKIGILGATGAVGRQMIQCLEEQSIPVDELRLFASARSAGGKLPFKGQDIVIEEVNETCFAGLDVVFGAVSNALAKQYAPHIVAAGALFIDNSSAFRLEDDVPLVVPEINGEDAKVNKGIIANPNCSTIIALMGVAPIHRLSPIKRMVAATYQAVSGAGNGGITELAEEIEAIRTAQPVTPSVFPYQIAYNCIPFIGSLKENGYTIKEVTETTYNPNVDDLGWFPNRRGIGDPYHRYSVFAVLAYFFNNVYPDPYYEIRLINDESRQ